MYNNIYHIAYMLNVHRTGTSTNLCSNVRLSFENTQELTYKMVFLFFYLYTWLHALKIKRR